MIDEKMFNKMQPVTTNSDGDRITKYWPPKMNERKDGDIVAGRYVGSVTFGKDDDKTTYYKLKSDKDIIGVRESAIIRTAFDTIKEGSIVAVRFNGQHRSKSGRMYNDFEVRIMEEDKPIEKTKTVTTPEVTTPEVAVSKVTTPIEKKEIDLSSIPF